jgi:similar to stage IV sporulation protein
MQLKNNYLVEIEGKNVYEFLKRIIQNKIEIQNIEYENIHKLRILISKEEYKKLIKIKTSYKFKIKKVYGKSLIKKFLKKHSFFIFSCIIAMIFLLILTNRITDIEVIHSDKNLRELLITVLEKENIKKGRWILKYDDITRVKEKILEEYKDKIEWLEINRVGTKYIVRLEERIIPDKKDSLNASHIVSNNYAIIKSIEATKGEIVKNKEDYVKPGDILISGDIYLNDTLKSQIAAEGNVYGEVWYKALVEYPYYYSEVKETGNTKKVYTFTFLNKKIEFTKKIYKDKKITSKTILKSNILPISFNLEYQNEVEIIKQNLTKEEAINKALEEIRKKVEETLTEKEHIISIKKLKVEENNSKIILEAFISVYKNIGVREDAIIINSEE